MLCHVFSYVCIRLQNGRVPEAVLHMHGYRLTVTQLTFHVMITVLTKLWPPLDLFHYGCIQGVFGCPSQTLVIFVKGNNSQRESILSLSLPLSLSHSPLSLSHSLSISLTY